LHQDQVSGPYYFWAFESARDTEFVQQDEGTGETMAQAKPIIIVPAPITAAGWDVNWVLMQRSGSEYYIFDLTNKKLHGAFTKEKFEKQRKSLGVPSALDFTTDYSVG